MPEELCSPLQESNPSAKLSIRADCLRCEVNPFYIPPNNNISLKYLIFICKKKYRGLVIIDLTHIPRHTKYF